MIFIYGQRFYGKVDEVKGLFHVKTKFIHIDYIPLVPTGSFIVLGQNGNSVRGVPIPLSAKSVFITWLRAASGVATVVSLIVSLVALGGAPNDFVVPLTIFAISTAAFILSMWYSKVTRASFNRACELGRYAGLTEHGYAQLERIYGEVASRGFDTLPIAASAAPLPVIPVEDPSQGEFVGTNP